MKKFISLVLAVIMMFAVLPVMSSAEENIIPISECGVAIKSGATYSISTAEEFILFEDGDLKFAVNVGAPEYYMNDPSCQWTENNPSIYYIKVNEYGGVSSGSFNIEQMLEQYNLKLISWKFSSPIENSFE